MPGQVRSDARRNYDRLLAVAAQCFAENGIQTSLRDVARRAGVGIGTLYRHFPTREALLEAVLDDRFDRLRRRAEELATQAPPADALRTWLREVAVGSATYRGLPEEVMAALQDPDSRLHTSCATMRTAGARLLTRAQDAGQIRRDVTGQELLALVAGLAWAGERAAQPELMDKFLEIAMAGLAA
ncbi:TetR/AcrR family transcriptional regulator [Actinospica robiniae]|uniref:TetR/AcrR family transcriptional regulator n=1 Tax=Actinospica robiniae TaxID=304901 RepID=UPI0003FDD867|nr:TetR/AcrR family transcriptional regulator [Actinospica robiniae]